MQIAGFKDAIGVSRADVENWLPKLDPSTSTSYAPTVPGVPREFSRDNVLELAVIAAMKKAGCPSVRTAANYAASVIRNDRASALPQWYAFSAGDFTRGRAVDNLAKVDFADLAAKSPNRTVALIHIGKIVETVDALFAQEAAV